MNLKKYFIYLQVDKASLRKWTFAREGLNTQRIQREKVNIKIL